MDIFFPILEAPVGFLFWLAKGCKTSLADEILKHDLRNMIGLGILIVVIIFALMIITN